MSEKWSAVTRDLFFPAAIMLYYLYANVEKFPVGNAEASQCACHGDNSVRWKKQRALNNPGQFPSSESDGFFESVVTQGGRLSREKRISHENHGQDMMMGAEAPIPPIMIPAATSKNLMVLLDSVLTGATTASPKGAPRRLQLPVFRKPVIAPPCPVRGPEAGSAHINSR